jgi:hypothetical protein
MAQRGDRLIKLSQDDERRVGRLAGYITLAGKIGEKYEKSKIKDVVEAAVPWCHVLGEVVLRLRYLGSCWNGLAGRLIPLSWEDWPAPWRMRKRSSKPSVSTLARQCSRRCRNGKEIGAV